MKNLEIMLMFTALIMTMVGCSRLPVRQKAPFRIKPYAERYRECVMGFVQVGVSPKQSGLLCDKALSCDKGDKGAD